MNYYIVAADRIVDHQGSHDHTQNIISKAKRKKLSVQTLTIVGLAKRWEDKLGPYEFKSGASAMDAINKARKLLFSKKAHIVVIKGEDFLKTGYTKEMREKFMKLYRKKFTPLDGYEKMVSPFLRFHGLSEKDFFVIRNALFENYFKTWTRTNPNGKFPDEKWLSPLTKHFRGVDCANPSIDYSGQLVITNDEGADALKIAKKDRIKILGNAFTKLSIDGLESIPKIITYSHTKKTITKAINEAKINFNQEFLNHKALLDAYTCYPIVPMGLLLRMGLVKKMTEIPNFLNSHEITISGGLNLSKAAWNLTSLNSIILMREKIMSSRNIHYGLIHGNGSLGNQQGITILGKYS